MAQTAAYFELTVDDLYGSSRSRVLATARQIAMYLCRELTDRLPKIGQLFGNRDHTTVMYANKKISLADGRAPVDLQPGHRAHDPDQTERPLKLTPMRSAPITSQSLVTSLWIWTRVAGDHTGEDSENGWIARATVPTVQTGPATRTTPAHTELAPITSAHLIPTNA